LIAGIRDAWDVVCEEAALTEVEQHLLGQRMFLNPFIFTGAPARLR
jgi:serine/threonine-protein kinase HipA